VEGGRLYRPSFLPGLYDSGIITPVGGNPAKEPVMEKQTKELLLLTVQHIQRTNEFLASFLVALEKEEPAPIQRMENPAPGVNLLKDILTIQDAITLTGFSRGYIYNLIFNKKIPYYKPNGGKIYFKKSELEEFLLHHKRLADYEVSNKADEILNERKGRVVKR
jgi:excisionase family DNA binding protein